MSEDVDEVAAGWHLAQQREDMDWDGFTAWLEADPAHRAAYDAIALLDFDLDVGRAALPANANPAAQPAPSRRRWWFVGSGIAVAATLAVTVGVTMREGSHPAEHVYASAAGTTRTVQIADGVSATLGAGSRLVASADAPLRLEGSAYFAIRHDPARAVTIAVGAYRVRDVGTRFAINSADGAMSVAVAEGSVAVRLVDGPETIVPAGREAVLLDRQTVELRSVPADLIGQWRSGRFVYADAPLALVVADVARYTGATIALDPGSARKRFSGVIAAGDRANMVATLSELTGLDVHNDGQKMRLGGRTGG